MTAQPPEAIGRVGESAPAVTQPVRARILPVLLVMASAAVSYTPAGLLDFRWSTAWRWGV